MYVNEETTLHAGREIWKLPKTLARFERRGFAPVASSASPAFGAQLWDLAEELTGVPFAV